MAGWLHTPTLTTQLWLAISLPLVAWDSAYVLLRPHSMEGGALHEPLFRPYRLYGEIDHVYGWEAYRAGSGFTAAQAWLNVLESALYLAYLWGARAGPRAGRAPWPLVVGFSAAVMTLSKTILYGMNEYCSGFHSVGHNSWARLVPLYIIPNGAWLVFSAYMVYSMGSDILKGLSIASAVAKAKKSK